MSNVKMSKCDGKLFQATNYFTTGVVELQQSWGEIYYLEKVVQITYQNSLNLKFRIEMITKFNTKVTCQKKNATQLSLLQKSAH